MINQHMVLGLQVETLIPAPHSNDVDVHSEIHIRMNSEIIPNSIIGNLVVFEDVDWKYKPSSPITSLENKVIVKGSINYQDRCIKFKPIEPLKANARYVIYLKPNGITSISSDRLVTAFSSVFYTETEATLPKIQIKNPTHGGVYSTFPLIEWESQESTAYVVQVSRNERFDVLVEEEVLFHSQSDLPISPRFETEKRYDDGVYYCRVKSLRGHWSEVCSFLIQAYSDRLISQEDADDKPYYEDYVTTPSYEVNYQFPLQDALQQSLKSSLIYVVVEGRVELADIDWNQTYVQVESFDENEEIEESEQFPIGKWHVIYQEEENQTYIIYEFGEEISEDDNEEIPETPDEGTPPVTPDEEGEDVQ